MAITKLPTSEKRKKSEGVDESVGKKPGVGYGMKGMRINEEV